RADPDRGSRDGLLLELMRTPYKRPLTESGRQNRLPHSHSSATRNDPT
ncbi:hypothetical protein EV189_4038, partial [Motilibacter rhizosphaerae]